MGVQWYPGHMTRTRKLLEEHLTLVDAVIELLDARIPFSSQNPDMEFLLARKHSIKVFNKSDLADPVVSNLWESYYQGLGIPFLFVDSLSGKGIQNILPCLKDSLRDRLRNEEAKGIRKRPIRAMVVGIPNVGKSTLINKLTKRAGARTGDKPGITQNKQWIRISSAIHLLDTPGILWPRINGRIQRDYLAFTGAIRDETLDMEQISVQLLLKLREDYPGLLEMRYCIDTAGKSGEEMLESIAFVRNFLIRRGQLDLHKAAVIFLDEFRAGKIGKISLEKPEQGVHCPHQ